MILPYNNRHQICAARPINRVPLVTIFLLCILSFTTEFGQDFRHIKIIETVDLITDNTREIFRVDYLGKVLGNYDNKMLFIAAILVYFEQLKENRGVEKTTKILPLPVQKNKKDSLLLIFLQQIITGRLRSTFRISHCEYSTEKDENEAEELVDVNHAP